MEFFDKLKELRTEKGVSQTELAADISKDIDLTFTLHRSFRKSKNSCVISKKSKRGKSLDLSIENPEIL